MTFCWGFDVDGLVRLADDMSEQSSGERRETRDERLQAVDETGFIAVPCEELSYPSTLSEGYSHSSICEEGGG